jgi:hypothetical protein
VSAGLLVVVVAGVFAVMQCLAHRRQMSQIEASHGCTAFWLNCPGRIHDPSLRTD